jgi:hypothetical protein
MSTRERDFAWLIVVGAWAVGWIVMATVFADRWLPVLIGAIALALNFIVGVDVIAFLFVHPRMKSLRALTVRASAQKWRGRFFVYTPGVFAAGLLIAALVTSSSRTWTGVLGYSLLGYTLISLTAVVAAGQGSERRKPLTRAEWMQLAQFLIGTFLSLVVLADGLKRFL